MQEDTQDTRESAANAVAPDGLTAQLLAKRAAGEKLTPKQYGKLGAWAARAKTAVFGPAHPAGGQSDPKASPGLALPMGAVPSREAPGGGLVVPAPDPRIVQRTTDAIIKACDGIARRKLVNEAKKAGADDSTANRFDTAAAVPVAAKEMMVETSPDVAAALGLDPSTYPIATFIGGLGLWATNLWLAVDELKKLQATSVAATAAAAAAKPPAMAATQLLPDPTRPPGAPNLVVCK